MAVRAAAADVTARAVRLAAVGLAAGLCLLRLPAVWGAFADDTRNPGNRFRVGEFTAPVPTATPSAVATASEAVCDLGPVPTVCPTPGPSAPAPAPSPEPEPVTEPSPVAGSEPAEAASTEAASAEGASAGGASIESERTETEPAVEGTHEGGG